MTNAQTTPEYEWRNTQPVSGSECKVPAAWPPTSSNIAYCGTPQMQYHTACYAAGRNDPSPVDSQLCLERGINPPSVSYGACQPAQSAYHCVAQNGACNEQGYCQCNEGWAGMLCQEKRYNWKQSTEFGACAMHANSTCGYTIKMKAITCEEYSWNPVTKQEARAAVDVSKCDPTTRPADIVEQCSGGSAAAPITCANNGSCKYTNGAQFSNTNFIARCDCPATHEGPTCADVVEYKWLPQQDWADLTCKTNNTNQCGDTYKTRDVKCVTEISETIVADSFCANLAKPETAQKCGVEDKVGCQNGGYCRVNSACECQWTGFTGSHCQTPQSETTQWLIDSLWSPCQSHTGQFCDSMFKTRTVNCVNNTRHTQPDERCPVTTHGAKPDNFTTDGCNMLADCGAHGTCSADYKTCECDTNWGGKYCAVDLTEPVKWTTGAWSACRTSYEGDVCGRMVRQRDVKCTLASTGAELQYNDLRCATEAALAARPASEDFTSCDLLSGCKNGGVCREQMAGTDTCRCLPGWDGDDCAVADPDHRVAREWRYGEWTPCQLLSDEPEPCEPYYRERNVTCYDTTTNEVTTGCSGPQRTEESCFMWYPPCAGQEGKWVGDDLSGKDPSGKDNGGSSGNNSATTLAFVVAPTLAIVVTFLALLF